MKNLGLVSIIMPVYNAEKYVKDAIESVLNQTYPYFELIIVNDGSTDKTLNIIESFKDERIKLINFKENKGVSNARNAALDVAEGKWIAFATGDDIWKSQRMQFLIKILSGYKYGKYFISDDLTICYEAVNGKLIPYGLQTKLWAQSIYKKFKRDNLIELEFSSFINIAFQPIFPSSVIFSKNYRFSPDLNFAEDLYFYAKLSQIGVKMLLTRESFYFYRITPGSLTDVSLEKLKLKIKKVESVLERDTEITEKTKLIFSEYFKKRIETMEQMHEIKHSFLKNNFRQTVILIFFHPITFLKYILQNIRNPYKLFCRIRVKYLAMKNGGVKRL